MPHLTLALLLVEQHQLIRSTVVSVAREIDLARIDEISSIEAAEQRLARHRYDGLLLAMDEPGPALALLERLRAGRFVNPRELPVVVMTPSCNAEQAAQLKQHEVRRVLLKPLKVKALLQTIESLRDAVAEGQPA